MATITSTSLNNQYQEFFSKQLLDHQIQSTVLNQWALKKPLDKNAGAKTISFFRPTAAAVDATTGTVLQVQDNTGTEGTPLSTFRSIDYAKISVTLKQFQEGLKVTDIVTMTALFNALKDGIALMGEDAALHADVITRNVLITGASNKRYSGASSFAALAAGSPSAGKARMTDFLDAGTALRIRNAKGYAGYFIAVICPQVSRDLRDDGDWIKTHQYRSDENIFKGEVGKWAGCRFVEHTNPFVEDSAASEGSYNASGAANSHIYRTFVFGQQAYGVPALAGEKVPMSDGESLVKPQIIVCDKADKSDPSNNFVTAAWKSYWNAIVLNAAWIESVSSKTEFI